MADTQDRENDPAFKAPRAAYTLADFKLVRRLGDGSYSQVVQARHNATDTDYALKMIDKSLVLRNKQTVYIKTERTLLDLFEYPGIVNLYFTFQDSHSLYLGLTLCPNGELYDQIRRKQGLSLEEIQFYAAEIVLILQYMRRHKVVHRDLKPENLLLNETGHIMLCDFGSAKILHSAKGALAAKQAEKAEPSSFSPLAQSGHPSPTHSGAAPQAAVVNLLDADMSTPTGNPFEGPHSSAPPAKAGPVGAGGVNIQEALQAAPSATPAATEAAVKGSPSTGSSKGEVTLASQLEQLAIVVENSQGADALNGEDQASLPRITSMVGTADYIAPETLENQAVTCAADLWSFGCLLYQMAAGKPPFKAASEYLTFNKISAAEFAFPKGFPKPVADLVGQLLVLKPSERLGASKIADLMEHPLFEGVEWDTLRESSAPDFLTPEGLEEDGEDDWELTSLSAAAAAAPTAAAAPPVPGDPKAPPGPQASAGTPTPAQQTSNKLAVGTPTASPGASQALPTLSPSGSAPPAGQKPAPSSAAPTKAPEARPVAVASPVQHTRTKSSPGITSQQPNAQSSLAGPAGHKAGAGRPNGWQGMAQGSAAGGHGAPQHAAQSNWQDGSAGNSLLAAGAVLQILGQDHPDAQFEF
ncbi:hypothetical protein WJX84_005775 [Apatococcus fuscideae]|uniref:non-specific serine/threonine protein kinase n=1 Tax=Apatococcus fuscideae TaxID=2026836 RepID=A0AAW1T2P3_9CHLO